MLELYVDPGVASELDLVILDPEWSRPGQTGALGALVLYLNRKCLYLNQKKVKGERTKMC
jgi:hypothetical protein